MQTAFREVADALAARGTLDEQCAPSAALVTARPRPISWPTCGIGSGVDSFLSALDAQRSLYSAQQQLQSARLLRLQNLVTLYKALGGGLREHVSTAQLTQPATSGSVPGPSLRSAAN